MYNIMLLDTNLFCILIEAASPSCQMSDRVLGRCTGITYQVQSTGLR